MSGQAERTGQPSAEEIRTALARITASASFAHSPQLANFLNFVVEATLDGRGERLKGYTVGVEGLGRSVDFDPQTDPIVRVEAGRLRRALVRYYAQDGRDDLLLIDLPSGHYVPSFSRRLPPPRLRRFLDAACTPGIRAAIPYQRITAAVAVIAIVVGTVWHLTQVRGSATASDKPTGAELVQTVSPFPLLIVEPFDVATLPKTEAMAMTRLYSRLRDALARFDEIEIATDPPPEPSDITGSPRAPQSNIYRLAASAEANADGTLTLYFRLLDGSDRLIVWTRNFDNVRSVGSAVVNEDDLVRTLAPVIAQPYGVIYARELARGPAHIDPRYRCVIDAFEFYRWHNAGQRQRMRACLGQITTANSTFSEGFALLAFEHLRDYYDSTGDFALLDRAISAAQRAVSLDSQSARAHQALMNALYVRGDVAAALAAGRRAVSSNPWDMIALTSYAIRLMWSGDIDQATTLLQKADEFSPGQPQFLSYALFMAAYIRNDDAAMARYANRMVSDTFTYGIAARAIAAVRAGERDRAQREIRKLTQSRPGWRYNAQIELQRYGMPAAVAARMTSDLNAAGLRTVE